MQGEEGSERTGEEMLTALKSLKKSNALSK